MRDRVMLNYNFLFGDHFAKVSNKAKLYYIQLLFFANNGFVANPLSVLKSMGYEKSVFDELVNNDELLTLPDRSEVFITSFYVHNKFPPKSWLSSPFSVYWKGKIWIKENGIVTFNPQGIKKGDDPMPKFITPPEKEPDGTTEEVDRIIRELEIPEN